MERRIDDRALLALSSISSSEIMHLFISLFNPDNGSSPSNISERESRLSSESVLSASVLFSLREFSSRGLPPDKAFPDVFLENDFILKVTLRTELISRSSLMERQLPISSLFRVAPMSLVPEKDTLWIFAVCPRWKSARQFGKRKSPSAK